MSTIYAPEVRARLVRRLDRLTPTASPRWGRMTPPAMVSHLIQSYRFMRGELTLPRWPVPFRRLVTWLALHVLPFPRGAPSAAPLLARGPATWSADLAALRALIDAFEAPPAERSPHPIFGALSDRDLGILAFKHTDHHLRQFGV